MVINAIIQVMTILQPHLLTLNDAAVMQQCDMLSQLEL